MRWSRALTTCVALAAVALPAQSLARAPRAIRLHVPQMPAPRAATLPAAWWQPGAVGSWQWQLTWPVDTTKPVQAYDIDYDGAGTGTPAQTAAIVSTLHAQGKRAICYLETGSWESYRPDAGDYAPSILGRTLAGFADERYVDIRQLDGARGPTGKTLHQILLPASRSVRTPASTASRPTSTTRTSKGRAPPASRSPSNTRRRSTPRLRPTCTASAWPGS